MINKLFEQKVEELLELAKEYEIPLLVTFKNNGGYKVHETMSSALAGRSNDDLNYATIAVYPEDKIWNLMNDIQKRIKAKKRSKHVLKILEGKGLLEHYREKIIKAKASEDIDKIKQIMEEIDSVVDE